MLDVRVVLRQTDGQATYGVEIPIVELLRTRDEGNVVGHLGPRPAARRTGTSPRPPGGSARIPAGHWWPGCSTSGA